MTSSSIPIPPTVSVLYKEPVDAVHTSGGPQPTETVGVPVCYFPNGDVARDSYACDLSSSVLPCCAVGAMCLDNQICRSNLGNNIRGACTDQTWKSSNCPQYCTGAATGGTDIISCQNVTNSNLDICCDHTVDCCDTGVGRFRLPSAGEPVTTIDNFARTATLHLSWSSTKLSSSTLASSFSSSFTTPISTNAPSQISSSTSAPILSTAAKVGIGVGASLGAIIIIFLSILLWRSKRKDRSLKKMTKNNSFIKGELDANETQKPDRRVQELSGDMAHELEGDRDRNGGWELPVE